MEQLQRAHEALMYFLLRFVTVPVVVCLTWLSACAVGDDAPRESPLVLSIRVAQSEFARLLPLEVEFLLRNPSDSPINLGKRRFTLADGLAFWITHDGQTIRIPLTDGVGSDLGSLFSAKHGEIAANSTLRCAHELVSVKGRPIFDKVGTYALRLEWKGDERLTAMASVNVLVASERTKWCANRIQSAIESECLSIDGYVSPKSGNVRADLDALYEISHAYADTPYASHCLATLLNSFDPPKKRVYVDTEFHEAFRRKVLNLTDERVANRPDARVCHALARYLATTDEVRARELAKAGEILRPGPVLAKRIQAVREATESPLSIPIGGVFEDFLRE